MIYGVVYPAPNEPAPVVNLFDLDGEETDQIEEAVSFVAQLGPNSFLAEGTDTYPIHRLH